MAPPFGCVVMEEVVVTCPLTGVVVPVGMELTKKVFERTTLYGNLFRCASCGNTHVWKKSDAWVRERP
jgi:hypothetical protein